MSQTTAEGLLAGTVAARPLGPAAIFGLENEEVRLWELENSAGRRTIGAGSPPTVM